MAHFPQRVNLVYGSRWSLWSGAAGRAAEVETVESVMKRRVWKTREYCWNIGIPVSSSTSMVVTIRSDALHHRILTGGIPPTLQPVVAGRALTKNNSWYFEFAEGEGNPFHIRSCMSDMYLTVSEEGTLLLDRNPPDSLWRWHDATRKYKKFFSGRQRADSEMPNKFGALTSLHSNSSVTVPESFCVEELRLAFFDGEATDAFEALREKLAAPEDVPLTPLRELLAKELFELCDDTSSLLLEGYSEVSVEELFPAVFARHEFVRRFHERRLDKDICPVLPRPMDEQGVPWGASSSLTCRVPLPVLGMRDYREVAIYAMCRGEDGELTLVVQQAGVVNAGYAGNFVSESVYFFSQTNSKGPIRFRAIAAAPSKFKSQALQGYGKSLADFLAVSREMLCQRSGQRLRQRSLDGTSSVATSAEYEDFHKQGVLPEHAMERALGEQVRGGWLSLDCVNSTALIGALRSAACGVCGTV